MKQKIPLMAIAVLFAFISISDAEAIAAGFYGGDENDDHLHDHLQIQVADGKVIAVRNRSPSAVIDLDVSEQVLASRVDGYVGGVLTTNRFMAISVNAHHWHTYDLEVNEAYSGQMLLSQSIVVLITNQRAVGFDARRNTPSTYEIPLGETVVDGEAAIAVAVFATAKRAVAFSARSGEFHQVEFNTGEIMRDLKTTAGLVTVETSQRFLTFQAATNTWISRDRSKLD